MKRAMIILMLNCLMWNTLFAASDTTTPPPAAKDNPPPATPAPPTQAQIDIQVSAQAIKMVNDQLKTDIKSADQILPTITQLYVDYYAKLRQCTPGTYKYALPLPNGGSYHAETGVLDPLYYFPVTIIQGLHDKKCDVDTKYDLDGIGSIEVKCQYLPASLQQFTEAEAKYAVNGNLDTISPSSQANQNQCHLSVDGTPYN